MMNKDEAVKKLATAGRLSMAHAEDLYDSFFEKPVVPQYVADWYEEAEDDFDYNLWEYLVDWEKQEPSDLKDGSITKKTHFKPLSTCTNLGMRSRKRQSTELGLRGSPMEKKI